MGIYKLQYPAACGGEPLSRWRTSGNSCARTGSPTGSSPPTATSSITAARRGTNSQTSLGSSCPSACATGLTGSDQWDLVLGAASSFGCAFGRGQGLALLCTPAL